MSMIKYIVNQNKRIPLMGEQLSANKIAALPQVKGQIGKTGILELLRGEKKQVKGFSIVEDRAPDRANKVGVEYVGSGKLRKRQPMRIYVKPCHDKGLTGRESGDFAKFLTSVYKRCNNAPCGVEYSELGQDLPGWSRNIIAVYAARAKSLGYVTTSRESGRLGKVA